MLVGTHTSEQYGHAYPATTMDYTWAEYMEAAHALGRKYDANWVTASWARCDGVQGAVGMMRRGWPEGLATVKAITAPMLDKFVMAHAPIAAWTWDVTGATWDMGEYLSGRPECWLNHQPIAPCRMVTVSIDLLSGVQVSAEAWMRRGAALVALVQALQLSGYVVDVWTVAGIEYNGRETWTRVRVGDTDGGILDFDRLMFAFAHPANARGVSYSLGYKQNDAKRRDGSIGFARTQVPAEWRGIVHMDTVASDACNWDNPRAVEQWVEQTYKDAVARAESSLTPNPH
jgi:hypothetical protein